MSGKRFHWKSKTKQIIFSVSRWAHGVFRNRLLIEHSNTILPNKREKSTKFVCFEHKSSFKKKKKLKFRNIQMQLENVLISTEFVFALCYKALQFNPPVFVMPCAVHSNTFFVFSLHISENSVQLFRIHFIRFQRINKINFITFFSLQSKILTLIAVHNAIKIEKLKKKH